MTESKQEITQLIINVPETKTDGIGGYELLGRIWRRKFWIIIPPVLATLVAVVTVLYILPERYASRAVIEPTDILYKMQLPGTLAGSGMISLEDRKNVYDNAQMIANFLDSWTFKERIIHEFNILKNLYPDIWDDERKTWKVQSPSEIPNAQKAIRQGVLDDSFKVDWDDKSQLFTISYIDRKPSVAKEVTGGILKELERFLREDRKAEAKRHRVLLENQLKEIKNEVAYWENQLLDDNLESNEILTEIEILKSVYAEFRYQLSIVRVEAEQQTPVFKVLDKPTNAFRVSPKRSRICALTMVISFLAAVLSVFLFELAIMTRKNR